MNIQPASLDDCRSALEMVMDAARRGSRSERLSFIARAARYCIQSEDLEARRLFTRHSTALELGQWLSRVGESPLSRFDGLANDVRFAAGVVGFDVADDETGEALRVKNRAQLEAIENALDARMKG
ncbi:MAG: hypothetical protein U0269_37845 [Polyangiales bacterium]